MFAYCWNFTESRSKLMRVPVSLYWLPEDARIGCHSNGWSLSTKLILELCMPMQHIHVLFGWN